mmetsp:Transcript_1212/g.2312  ORF Transcript_1212/g.2312 Transcript_1212/m.2312 type:complete len:89 (+) Transcript_1212:160-426(+)
MTILFIADEALAASVSNAHTGLARYTCSSHHASCVQFSQPNLFAVRLIFQINFLELIADLGQEVPAGGKMNLVNDTFFQWTEGWVHSL